MRMTRKHLPPASRRGIAAVMGMLLLTCAVPAQAAEIAASVRDEKGAPVFNAVVYAYPAGGKTPAPVIKPVNVSQHDKEFVPDVTVVPVNTPVFFPNNDDIRHHVYSLSKAKVFEIPLYSGNPANPVIFDKTGVVAMGCNIHDWMLAYIYVVDTPYFAKTGADGKARLEGLAEEKYTVMVWHPWMKGQPQDTATAVAAGGNAHADFTVPIKTQRHIKRAPILGGHGY